MDSSPGRLVVLDRNVTVCAGFLFKRSSFPWLLKSETHLRLLTPSFSELSRQVWAEPRTSSWTFGWHRGMAKVCVSFRESCLGLGCGSVVECLPSHARGLGGSCMVASLYSFFTSSSTLGELWGTLYPPQLAERTGSEDALGLG